MTDRRLILIVALTYAIAGLSLYSEVIRNGIFLFDDFEYVAGNPLIQDFSLFTRMTDPRHIGYLSFALNYAVHGETPFGFHLVNVMIHVSNALLVFLLALQIWEILSFWGPGAFPPVPGGPPVTSGPARHAGAAFLAGLIFLVHPVETQSVSYITQRFTSLCTLFYLLSVYLYLEARLRFENNVGSRMARILYGLSLLSTVLAMKTKEIAFTIPFAIAVFELLLFRHAAWSKKRFIYLIPYGVSLLIVPLSLFGPEWGLIAGGTGVDEVTRTDKLYDLYERSGYEYLLTQFRVIVTYIRLLLLPMNQQVVYDFRVSHSLLEPEVIVSLIVLLGIAGGGVYFWKKGTKVAPDAAAGYRIAALGIAWFFIALSVESSVIPIKDIIFEHRVYLPSVGFVWALSVLLTEGVGRFRGPGHGGNRVLLVTVMFVALLSAGTYARNSIWTDEIRFWNDVVQKTGKAIGYNNRGNAYAKAHQYDLALQDLDKVISFFPPDLSRYNAWENSDFTPSNMSKTYKNRGQMYEILGNMELAEKDYEMARKIMSMPVNVERTLKIADGYAKRGAYSDAITEYGKILEWDPENVEALNDRGNAFSYSKLYRDAIQDFDRVIALRPDYALAYHNRGIAYFWSGNSKGAVSDFQKACDLGFMPSCEATDAAKNDGRR